MFKTLLAIAAAISTFSAQAEISEISSNQSLPKDYVSTINPNAFVEEEVTAGGFNELMKYVVAAPSQEDAGSCLYMSHTGVVEWWYNRLNNLEGDKKINFAERYYMSLKTNKTNQEEIENWRTDNIRRINKSSVMFSNQDYRFTKGNFKKVEGKRVVTDANDEDGSYGTQFNWIDLTDSIDKNAVEFKLPKFKREVLHVDADKDQWAVAKAPADIVERIKKALHKRNAPVLVIYNHKGFWHANYIFGYNDNADTKGCPFVSSFKPHMEEKRDYYLEKAEKTKSETWRKKYLANAEKVMAKGNAVQKRFEEVGCASKGVFYVRDSIYPNENMPKYDYDLVKEGEEDFLNAPLIAREYAWVQTTLNHAIQIYPEGME
ncbi:hypothetical protein ACRXCV_11015 [Halobacteriovorax sp. GFR7]|uniref:hypothetical protein n=1 Tax=unclassified Halobacteriovorax TaxID=2639665 RepID=UPI003D9943AA